MSTSTIILLFYVNVVKNYDLIVLLGFNCASYLASDSISINLCSSHFQHFDIQEIPFQLTNKCCILLSSIFKSSSCVVVYSPLFLLFRSPSSDLSNSASKRCRYSIVTLSRVDCLIRITSTGIGCFFSLYPSVM